MDVLKSAGCTSKTISHAERMFAQYGYEIVFGRGDVSALLKLTPSPASALLKKLVESGVIEAVVGQGKGKYRFKPLS